MKSKTAHRAVFLLVKSKFICYSKKRGDEDEIT